MVFVQIVVAVFCLLILGQFLAIWPWVLHRKHQPSALYLALSSSVSFLNGREVVASTSIGTTPLFLVLVGREVLV